MLSSRYFHICLIETCSIYRIGIVRLGICHVLDGLVAILIGAALMWMNQGTIWSGIGVWTGLPMMMAGVICFMSRQRKHRGAISGVTVLSIIAMMCATFLLSSSAYNINKASKQNYTIYFPQYKFTDRAPMIISNSFLILFSLIEVIICLWSACISMGIICRCCNYGKDQVFTIPYVGMENEGPVGPDIVQPPVRQRHANSSTAFMEELDDGHVFTDMPPAGKTGTRQGANKAPVLQIDMDLEWDEMVTSTDAYSDEIDQSVLMVGTDAPPNLGIR